MEPDKNVEIVKPYEVKKNPAKGGSYQVIFTLVLTYNEAEMAVLIEEMEENPDKFLNHTRDIPTNKYVISEAKVTLIHPE